MKSNLPLALSAPIAVALALASCSQDEVETPQEDASAGVEEPTQSAAEMAEMPDPATPDESDPPEELIRTAWRVEGEDGARYTTYIDEDGSYRDLKNGDLWQTGSWSRSEGDDSLCLTPDTENARTMCWQPVRMEGNRAMIVKSDADRTVRLEKVDYRFPDEE